MKIVEETNIVEINYMLKNDQGELLDSSEQSGALTFMQGQGEIFPRLDAEIAGKQLGEVFDVVIAPEDAYGAYDESMVRAVPKSYFGSSVEEIQVGSVLQIEAQRDQPVMMKAVEINDDTIILDANHPMAGQALHFNVEILSVRDATPDELSRGSAHDPQGGCACC